MRTQTAAQRGLEFEQQLPIRTQLRTTSFSRHPAGLLHSTVWSSQITMIYTLSFYISTYTSNLKKTAGRHFIVTQLEKNIPCGHISFVSIGLDKISYQCIIYYLKSISRSKSTAILCTDENIKYSFVCYLLYYIKYSLVLMLCLDK